MLEDGPPLLALYDVERSTGTDLFQVPPAPAVLTAEQMMQRQIAELQQQLAATAVAVQHMRAARDQAQLQAVDEHRLAMVMQDEARLAHEAALASRHQAAMASQEAHAASSRVGQAEMHAAALQQAAQRESAHTQACVQQLQAAEQQRVGAAHADLRTEEEAVTRLREQMARVELQTRDAVQELHARMQRELQEYEVQWERQRSEDRQMQMEMVQRTQQICQLEAKAASLAAVAQRPPAPSAQRAQFMRISTPPPLASPPTQSPRVAVEDAVS
ncbi:MAG: hypothetical protein GY772_21970, partial [bacterium]|nr:hypothetical protein [bacterium]